MTDHQIKERLGELVKRGCEQTLQEVFKTLYPGQEMSGVGHKEFIANHFKYLSSGEQLEYTSLITERIKYLLSKPIKND